MSALISDILADSEVLDPRRGERGMAHGRRSSTPVARRAPADLDVLSLTDPRTGVLAVLSFWAGRIRWEKRIYSGKLRSRGSEAAVIDRYWSWAVEQPWGAQMVVELTALAERLHHVRYGVPMAPCPVCGIISRVDRFVIEHRACIDSC